MNSHLSEIQAVQNLFRFLPQLSSVLDKNKIDLYHAFNKNCLLDYENSWQEPIKLYQFIKSLSCWQNHLHRELAKECMISAAMRWSLMRFEFFFYHQIEICLSDLPNKVIQLTLSMEPHCGHIIKLIQYNSAPKFDSFRFNKINATRPLPWVAI